jgi:hypothetical protein
MPVDLSEDPCCSSVPVEETSTSSTSPCSDAEWSSWLSTHTQPTSGVPADYGLARIARFLGPQQVAALQLALDATELEASGDIAAAMKKYAAAYRQWPALDSVHAGGLPLDVRRQAIASGYLHDHTHNVLLDVVDVPKARASAAIVSTTRLLSDEDLRDLDHIQQQIGSTVSALHNNPENQTHAHKQACMMNNPPDYVLQTMKPSIVGKIIRFAQRAWMQGNWSGPGGPLEHVKGGVDGLSIRVVELWEYTVGGGLADSYHYDTDSVVTIVTLLSHPEDFDGGDFRTYEVGDIHKCYEMSKGDAVAFVSHKFHNITELTRGCRRSLVMELWQGGVGHEGR